LALSLFNHLSNVISITITKKTVEIRPFSADGTRLGRCTLSSVADDSVFAAKEMR